LNFLALPGLFKPSSTGWTMVFYSMLVGVAENCLIFSVGGLVGSLIGGYLLFQIRPYYFGEAVLTPDSVPAAGTQTPPQSPNK
jgi:hypothetical protein